MGVLKDELWSEWDKENMVKEMLYPERHTGI